jgi:hypothetical protein
VGGTLALARAGLLDSVSHTSNSADFLQQNAIGYESTTLYRSSQVAVVADRVITAPGPAPVSFTCAVFEAAGLSSEIVSQFRSLLAAEHGSPLRPTKIADQVMRSSVRFWPSFCLSPRAEIDPKLTLNNLQLRQHCSISIVRIRHKETSRAKTNTSFNVWQNCIRQINAG